MESSYYKKQTIRPYLNFSGVFIAVAAGIKLHFSIGMAVMMSAVTGYYYYYPSTGDILASYSQAEHTVGMVGIYGGLASIIVIIAIIGSVFDNEKQRTSTALTLLLFYVGFDLFKTLYLDQTLTMNTWLELGILLVYGIFRGISLSKVNKSLNISKNKYGSGFFGLYAWSYLVTFIITFIIAIIAAASDNYGFIYNMLIVGVWVNIGQYFLDGIAWTGIGLKFLLDAMNKPIIGSKVTPRTAPAVTTGVELGMGQYNTKGPVRPAELETQTQADEEVLKYCTHCGAQNFKDHTFCENCGKSMD